MTALATADDIVIDTRSGRVEGASAPERMAIALLRAANAVLRPFHDYGFSYVARATRKLLPSRKAMLLELAEDSRMRIDYCDAYWSTLLAPGYPYEPWIMVLLADSTDVPYGFIDGGANHGFWSILVSGKSGGAKKAVAVEAASDTFRHLEDNCRLNGGRFTTLNMAIGAESGQQVRIYGFKHESRTTVAPSPDAAPILDCETISLDDIAARPEFADIDKFLVKLDVEGVEVPAFEGARRLIDGDTAFVYEDHGSDRDHATTRHVLDALSMRVFWLDPGEPREIQEAGELDGIKKSRRFGYDLVATRSAFWIERLERLAGRNGRTA